jgi:hypothetical protein
MLSAALLGLVLGLRHAFDPDHVIAVSTIVARHRGALSAAWIGVSWGIGHAATIFAIGFLVIALHAIPRASRRRWAGIGAARAARRREPAGRKAAQAPLLPEPAASLRSGFARSGAIGTAHGPPAARRWRCSRWRRCRPPAPRSRI